jgi:hypothetical protein
MFSHYDQLYSITEQRVLISAHAETPLSRVLGREVTCRVWSLGPVDTAPPRAVRQRALSSWSSPLSFVQIRRRGVRICVAVYLPTLMPRLVPTSVL